MIKTGELRYVINFRTLCQLLGDNAVEDADEMYQLTWQDKQEDGSDLFFERRLNDV